MKNALPFAFVTRRGLLAGAVAAAAWPAGWARAAESVAAILERSGLRERSGFALADAATGEVIGGFRQEVALPPASVVKILTALYALDALGGDFRFRTRLVATGPVEDGTVRGDLVLAGGGDPVLDTDALGDMAKALADQGVRAVAGRFLVAEGALPRLRRIEADQPVEAGYNPAISGMNLNFNRVCLTWAPGAAGPAAEFRAAGARFDVPAAGFALELSERGPADRRGEAGTEIWTLPRASLRGTGSVWLPVTDPAGYAGAVFRELAGGAGLVLPPAEPVADAPAGETLAEHASEPLEPMMREMLHYSTNLTAEVAGLAASRARGVPAADLGQSGRAMTDWAVDRYGLGGPVLVNHSGLTDRSRVSAEDIVRVLAAEHATLPALLRERPILDAERKALKTPVRMVAKTGTIYFACALAGYLQRPGGRQLAFAILAADPEARARITPEERTDPPGADAWAGRARRQEQALLRRWAAVYAG